VAAEREHWERVYAEKPPDTVSWFEPTPRSSLAMIDELELPLDAPIIDVGGGTSGLAGELLDRGYTDLTVVDISSEALERARESLTEPGRITGVVADVRGRSFGRRYALWHDRAVFHFMVEPADREAYLTTLERSIASPGHVIVATFGPEAPPHCSGLPVARYDADALGAAFTGRAELISSHLEVHRTPSGTPQQFLFAHLIAGRPRD
jgi:SAM-dependent methyltransferase